MLKTRSGTNIAFKVDEEKLNRVVEIQKEMGNDFPKFGILVLCYNATAIIEKTLGRIPKQLHDAIEEIFIFDDNSPDGTFNTLKDIKQKDSFWKDKLSIFRNPRNLGYGGNQKVGYRYAINKGLDYVIMLHGDGQYAPEYIPDLMLPALETKQEVVFASRMLQKSNALKGGMPFYKWIGNQVLTWFENTILGTKLSEFHSGYRMYSTKVLKNIPFEENTNVFHFDTQIIVQCRALAVPIHEVPIQTYYGDEECNVDGIKYAKDVCFTVLEYRLHQLHILRKGRYLVNRESLYTRKSSPYSSHEQIISLIKGPGKALELGSSQGFLTESLKRNNVSSICVDSVAPEIATTPCDNYIQLDLKQYKKMNFSREFDYIILSDVIEHMPNGKEIMNYIQRFLKEDGKIIVSVPNIAIWFYRLSLLIGRFNYGPKGILDETHVRFYTLSTIKQLLERSGYIITNIKPTSIPLEVIFESIGQSQALKLLDRIYYFFATLWPSMFAYQFVVEGEISSFIAEEGEEKY